MECIYLTDIPFACGGEELARQLCIADEDDRAQLDALLEQARAVARPKAAIAVCPVREVEKDVTDVGGMIFRSRIMAKNFEGLDRVYPYAATCGEELYDWAQGQGDPFWRYCADAILTRALTCARSALTDALAARYGVNSFGSMTPGSLPNWGLEQLRPLLANLGGKSIGITLTPRLLMLPNKSVCGIFFASETHYENCALCPRENCPNRRMKYNPALADQYMH